MSTLAALLPPCAACRERARGPGVRAGAPPGASANATPLSSAVAAALEGEGRVLCTATLKTLAGVGGCVGGAIS